MSKKAPQNEVLTGEHYISGNEAIAEGCLAAGCKFFGGYPITPSSEIAERISQRLPLLGGVFIQMEDEIASMATILGASWAGKKSMTATSGPGISLMMENIGLGVMTETPCVIINVQRGGPSTGLPTLVGQQDVMQARWGSHGDYELIALAPNSVQEAFDLSIECFNLAEEYRTPVIMLTDESICHMFEKLVIPPKSKIKIKNRKKPKGSPKDYLTFKPDADLIPPMATAGEGYKVFVTGLTHNEKGYPVITAEAQEILVKRLCDKILLNEEKIRKVESYKVDDAKVLVIAYGITSRSAKGAVDLARKKGIKAGLLRLITIWPFPTKLIAKLAEKTNAIVVAEINNGQIIKEVKESTNRKIPIVLSSKLGGIVHTPKEILMKIEEVAKK
ncbi:MAG: 2-oxoacid:acceptor oxidoreductase subunit alpha [Candidatus Heimdallarchaeota archaeon]|nr:2-oxoacid:acceptor oxidoreductase subunit alpha [Candidatus Heimdallarchaeota archaeon]MCG3253532.1 2-oxoacid:acceptor oxidoreductase subunit alpha [Candidatus Heimdallarchaeota archaeon]MCK4290669.1 2-oxoacid:acceptor oxidoreductase subunit alpha [Candidatus Heimdallarchaeota archaeon]